MIEAMLLSVCADGNFMRFLLMVLGLQRYAIIRFMHSPEMRSTHARAGVAFSYGTGYRFLYLRLKTRIRRFTSSEKILVAIMAQSSFIKPYHTQRPSPERRMRTIGSEMSFAFFSLMIFTSCGSMDAAVNTPATVPIIYGFKVAMIIYGLMKKNVPLFPVLYSCGIIFPVMPGKGPKRTGTGFLM
jgi:hypothetical protein